jgi:DNA-binding NarL/FixJ family response regulator
MSEPRPDETATSGVSPEDRITVALIEDNLLVLEALSSLLNRSEHIRVVAAEPSDHESLLEGVDPQVVLLDLGLENGDSLRVARKVLRSFPQAKVVVMDLLPVHEDLTDFVSAGVSGFIMKDASLEVVTHTIRSVASGMKVLPNEMTGALFSEIAKELVLSGGREAYDDSVRLTRREREVIDLIAEGMSNKAIGKQLHISVHTVKSHLRNIMEKLTLRSRLEIANYVHSRDTDD